MLRLGIQVIAETLLAVVFLLVTGAWASTETVIYSFSGYDGYMPESPVGLDSSGNVYGMTTSGGAYGIGNVYQLVNTSGTWTWNDLYDFTGGKDGALPIFSGVVMDSSGNLYGTTLAGGAHQSGVVFELAASRGTWTEKVLYSFKGGKDADGPYASLAIDSRGNLYGTTTFGGGDSGGCFPRGCGTVFELTKTGRSWKETILHVFKNNGVDGVHPWYQVTLDKSGTLYGTTYEGGAVGNGVVFRLTKPTKGNVWKETILHSFTGYADGCLPSSGLILDGSGNLYGTTGSCGKSYGGTVYQLRPSGQKYTNKTILQFDGAEGLYPYDYGILAMDKAGNIYGSASSGGANNAGTVFKLSAGSWGYSDLHDFDFNGDGLYPYSGITLDSAGDLYGTTANGGSDGYGIVYQITP